MSETKRLEIITGLARPLVESMGLVLWGVEEALAGRRTIVRVYIDAPAGDAPVGDAAAPAAAAPAADAPDAPVGSAAERPDGHAGTLPAGATIDDCAEVSRALGTALDVEDMFAGAYDLEVSSPGLDRFFFSPEQMAGYIGEEVKLTLVDPVEDRKRFRGKLLGVDGRDARILADGREFSVPWDAVKKAQLVYKFPEPQSGRKASGGRGDIKG